MMQRQSRWTGALIAVAMVAMAPQLQAQEVAPTLLQRPADAKPYAGPKKDLVEIGKTLWTSQKLGTNGQSCNTCHATLDTYSESFRKPYPHFVQIVKDKTGLDNVTAEQMVQFCITMPLAGKPLDWSSQELAALVAYVEVRQKLFADLKK